jgi:hypothetical protein
VAMMQEESCMKLHSDANGSVEIRSALVVSNSSIMDYSMYRIHEIFPFISK